MFKQGDICFLIESNQIVRQVQIISVRNGLYTVKFLDIERPAAIRVSQNRLYATDEEAKQIIDSHKLKKTDEESANKKSYKRETLHWFYFDK